MILRLASHDDLETLILVRLDFFREMFPPQPAEDLDSLAETLRLYYHRHLGVDFWAVLAEDGERPAGAAFLNVSERPANPGMPGGWVGELSNVFTYPQYRRRGLAADMVRQLIGVAGERGVSRVDLSASDAGRAVYEKLGFGVDIGHTRMHLRLNPGKLSDD